MYIDIVLPEPLSLSVCVVFQAKFFFFFFKSKLKVGNEKSDSSDFFLSLCVRFRGLWLPFPAIRHPSQSHESSFVIHSSSSFFIIIFILSCQALSTSRQSIASNQHYCVVCSISSCDISRKPKSESTSDERYLFLMYLLHILFIIIIFKHSFAPSRIS